MFAHFGLTQFGRDKGRPLSAEERALFKPYFASKVIESARIFEGKVPFWLRHDMCAVVLGTRIYLRQGAYQPNTKHGAELLGHELTHVSQYFAWNERVKVCLVVPLWLSQKSLRVNRLCPRANDCL